MYSMWNAPSDRDYYDQGWQWPEEEDDDRCSDCGARFDQACMESCTATRLATHDDLDEDPFASDPDDFEELNRNEADDYRNELGVEEYEDEPCNPGADLDCAGLELAEEWA